MRLMIRLIALAGLAFVSLAALGGWAERWILYPFDSSYSTPVDAGVAALSESRIPTDDGASLVVWHAPAKRGRPVILYFHGNAGNLASRAGRFTRFINRGYGIVAPAYRGSSGSEGTPSEEALIADAKLIRKAMQPGGALDMGQDVVNYGESLGTAVSIALLAQDPKAAKGVILEAPFSSLADLAQHHYPQIAKISAALDSQWPSETRAKTALSAPLLILHGSQDTLIPYAQGTAIHAAAPSRNKQMLRVSGAGHTDLWRSDTLPKIWRFIDGL